MWPCDGTLSWDGELCQYCRTIMVYFSLDGDELDHYFSGHTISALRQCSACRLCRLLLSLLESSVTAQQLEQLAQHDPALIVRLWYLSDRAVFMYYPLDFSCWPNTETFRIDGRPFAELSERRHYGEVKLHESALDDSPSHRSHAVTSESTGSQDTFDLIAAWLQICSKHDDCHGWRKLCSTVKDFMPTRLLQIDRAGDTHVVRVVESASLGTSVTYAVLSHCWGSVLPSQLRHDNIEAFRRAIDWMTLPKTFQETIDAVARLGLQYLWIDALCILQDDVDDWSREAALMGDVYTHAYVCIAASASSNATEGLYRARNPSLMQSICVRTPDAESGSLLFCAGTPSTVERSALSARGWALQERYLSPRIIHFTESQVFWECQELTTSESFSPGLGLPDWHHHVWKDRLQQYMTDSSRQQVLDHWRTVVAHYSTKALTFSSDKPAAIAGLSRVFARLLDVRHDQCYAYGIWTPWLRSELMWHSPNARWTKTHLRPRSSDIPSWSWLSLNNARPYWCTVHDLGMRFFVETGPVSSSLTMRAPLCQVTLDCLVNDTFLIDIEDEDTAEYVRYQMRHSNERWGINFAQASSIKHFDKPRGVNFYDSDDIECAKWVRGQDQVCYLMYGQVQLTSEEDVCWHNFLVLRPAEQSGSFRRVGFVKWLLSALDVDHKDHASDDFPWVDETGRLTPAALRVAMNMCRVPDGLCDGPDDEGYYSFTLV